MGKLTSKYVHFIVDDIASYMGDGEDIIRLIGDISNSNLLPKGRYSMPIEISMAKNVSIGDELKLTFFIEKDSICGYNDKNMLGSVYGIKIETLNVLNGGWDKTFERILKEGENWNEGPAAE